MNSKCKRCFHIICQRLFKLINILIDLIFGIFHYFMKDEEYHLRYASVAKFTSAAILSTLDVFQVPCDCCCCCCSKKQSQEGQSQYEILNAHIKGEINILRIKNNVLGRLANETNTSNEKFKEMAAMLKELEELEKKSKEYISFIVT